MTSKQAEAVGKGEATRDHLIEVGGRLFSEHGFAGVSVRQIASAAGVGLGVISYHFKGGKEGLYGAVLEEVMSGYGELPYVGEAGYEALSDEEKLRMYVAWAVRDALSWCEVEGEGGVQGSWQKRLMLREIMEPSDFYLKWYLAEGVKQTRELTMAVAGMLGRHELDERVNHCVMSVLGMIYVYYYEQSLMRVVWPSVYSDGDAIDRLNEFTEAAVFAVIERARAME